MVLPNTTQLGYWVTAIDCEGRPPFAFLRQTILLHDQEIDKYLYAGHEQIRERLRVKSFRTRHQALLWAS